MKILVAGASGQVARSITEAAQRLGVVLVARGRTELDLTSETEIDRALSEVAPDLVINAAAYTAVDQAESEPETAHLLNETAPGWLAQQTCKVGVPMIHLSTDYVFDGGKSEVYVESDNASPIGVYGVSKLAGERLVAQFNPRHLIVRTSWVYSPFGKNFVKTMLRLAVDREEVAVVSDQFGTPTYAPSLARGLLSMATRLAAVGDDVWGVYHMAAPDDAVWADVAEAVFSESKALGGPFARVRRISAANYPTPAQRPYNSRLDSHKVKAIFGVELPRWRDDVRECVSRLAAEWGS